MCVIWVGRSMLLIVILSLQLLGITNATERTLNDLNKLTFRFVRRCSKNTKRYVKLPVNRTFERPPLGQYDHSFYEYYVPDCNIDTICVKDFFDAYEHQNHELVRHYLEPGTSFWLPTSDSKPLTWLVGQLLDIINAYNASTKDFVFVHVEDEFRDYNATELFEFYQMWRKSYRVYWWDTINFNTLRTMRQLEWLPSLFLKTPKLPWSKLKIASERPYNIAFRANTNTNSRRGGNLYQIVTTLNVTVIGSLNRTGAFGVDLGGDYLGEMMNSKFCLTIRGRSAECHRFYEALECGCIPVMIDKYWDYNYGYEHSSQFGRYKEILWRKTPELPFIWARDVNHFKEIYDSLVNNGTQGLLRLNEMQSDCLEWWTIVKRNVQMNFQRDFCIFP